MNRLALMRTLFAAAARHHEDVAAALAPLHADFAAYAAPHPTDRARLGEWAGGPGVLAPPDRAPRPFTAALDFAPEALALARRLAPQRRLRLRGHERAARSPGGGSFTLLTASFALHATLPAHSLPALRCALAPGGRLVIQEWGPADALHLAVDDLLAGHASDSPPPGLSALRTALASLPLLWSDMLQDVEDYREWLAEYGFGVEQPGEGAPVDGAHSVAGCLPALPAGPPRPPRRA